MQLRKLILTDAPEMIKWMHDKNVVDQLEADFSRKTLADAELFIRDSWDDSHSIHLAIATNENEYMGTVSLKNINNKIAEFAIVVCSKAMGRGYAWFGMKSMLDQAFDKYKLEAVYWCVKQSNQRAISFYTKHCFVQTADIPHEIQARYDSTKGLTWFVVRRGEFFELAKEVAGCKIIQIHTIPSSDNGQLSVFEAGRDVPFQIKRIYYITKVNEGMKRGFHAHKRLKQLIFCPHGKVMLTLETRKGKGEIILSDPSKGLIIDTPTWREITWLEDDSVLCVAASDYYDEKDYIRDHDLFVKSFDSQEAK